MQLAVNEALIVFTVVAAAWSDWKRRQIPNFILGISASTALLMALFSLPGVGLSGTLLGGFVGLALFLPFYIVRGMAAGDVKLLAVLGMHAGPVEVIKIAIASALVGGLWAIVFIACRLCMNIPREDDHQVPIQRPVESVRETPRHRNRPPTTMAFSGQIPYGVVMAIGSVLVIIQRILVGEMGIGIDLFSGVDIFSA